MTSKKSAERFSPDAGFLMSTLGSEETGIDRVVICVCAGEFGSTGNQLGPRLLVVLGDRLSTESLKDATTVQLTSPPQLAGNLPPGIARQVTEFINTNRDVLLRYWSGGLGTRDMLDLLRRA